MHDPDKLIAWAKRREGRNADAYMQYVREHLRRSSSDCDDQALVTGVRPETKIEASPPKKPVASDYELLATGFKTSRARR